MLPPPALLALLVPVGFPTLLPAQFDANLGRIVGRVAGPDGAPITAAEVVVLSVESGVRRSALANDQGLYRVGLLRPGEYAVTASSPDFAPSTVRGVVVKVGGAVDVDLQLELEETYQQIEVTASMLPATSNVVGSEVFNDLSINGRRFHDFALLTPTVQVSRAAGHLSFAAQRGTYTNTMVDGTYYSQTSFGGIQGGERAGSVITLPQSAIQEFQAVTSGITAEYGRTVSGVVNVSAKSGGNDLRGDLFYQIRHPRLGLADPFGAKVLERLQQFGGSAGGALRRDRAFWFAAFERQASSSPRYVGFAALAAADRDRGPEAFDLFKSLEEPFESTNDALAVTPRLDYYFRGGSQLMVRYNASDAAARNSISIGDPKQSRTPNALSHDGTEEDSVHFLTGQLTSVLSPKAVNQFRVTVTHESRPRPADSSAPTVTTTIGNFGTRFFLPTVETDVTPVIKNSLMLSAGAHDVKFGGDFDRMVSEGVFGYNQFGNFVVFSSDPGEVLDILTPGGRIPNRFDAPGLYFRQVGSLTGEQRVAQASLFVQDSWLVREGLTVDLGFRWEGQFNQWPRTGNRVLVDRVLAAEFAFGGLDPAATPTDARKWMPRLGFANSPGGRLRSAVLRGSFGVFHGATPPVWLAGSAPTCRDPPRDPSVALPTAAPTVYRQFLAAGIDLNAVSLAYRPLLAAEEVARVLSGDPFRGAYLQAVTPASAIRGRPKRPWASRRGWGAGRSPVCNGCGAGPPACTGGATTTCPRRRSVRAMPPRLRNSTRSTALPRCSGRSWSPSRSDGRTTTG